MNKSLCPIISKRFEISKQISKCNKYFLEQDFNKCLGLANQAGFETFTLLKEKQSNENIQCLLIMDLKTILLLTTECIKKARCQQCYINHMKSVLELLQNIKKEQSFSLYCRQRIGQFLNEMLEMIQEEGLRLHFRSDLFTRRHHLLIAN